MAQIPYDIARKHGTNMHGSSKCANCLVLKLTKKTEIEVMLKTEVEKFNRRMNSEQEKMVWNEPKPVAEVASLGEDAELAAESAAENL